MVKKLVDVEDFAGLRAISQQYIENAMYHICFGLHNGRGIHGATPLELLHAIWKTYQKFCYSLPVKMKGTRQNYFCLDSDLSWDPESKDLLMMDRQR
jgi:hypothetical protein